MASASRRTLAQVEGIGMKRIVDDFWSHVKIGAPDECWPWLRGRTGSGYGRVRVGKIVVYTHRYAYALTHGAIPDGFVVCHKCDNPPCCNPAHLQPGTPAENMRDRDSKGRAACIGPRSQNVNTAKLTPADAVAIRRRFSAGEKPTSIAKDYPVALGNIYCVIHRQTWRNAEIEVGRD